jgi:hypothetical protein
MRRLFTSLFVVALIVGFAAPSIGYAQQSFNIYLGGFVPKGEDGRSRDDVLVNNLNVFAFNIEDFHSFSFGGEYLIPISDFLDAGLGAGFQTRKVPSVYSQIENENGAEIEQDLKLRVAPFTATVRFLPLGRRVGVQPYIGGGVGVFAWRYSETGDFVDSGGFDLRLCGVVVECKIFRDNYVGSGATAGPVILGGLRFPAGGWDIGGEIRWQSAQGELPTDQSFFGTEIDLGGLSYLATFNVRF